jgi:hypothetical protein
MTFARLLLELATCFLFLALVITVIWLSDVVYTGVVCWLRKHPAVIRTFWKVYNATGGHHQ